MFYLVEFIKPNGSGTGKFLGIHGPTIFTSIYCIRTIRFYDKESAEEFRQFACHQCHFDIGHYKVTEHMEADDG